MRHFLVTLAASLLAVAATAAGDQAPPLRLSQTGLYEDGRVGIIASSNVPFSPQYPLWTDGAAKSRWVFIPSGAVIDASDPAQWNLPVGTRLWKQFSFSGRRVETRMIWRVSVKQWVFASYRWNEAQTDADLVPETGVWNAAAIVGGKSHSIPSRAECGACHGTEPPRALGFTALQLSPDRDPRALHGEPVGDDHVTLDTLLRTRRLIGGPEQWKTRPPRIQSEHENTRAALGYLLANCGSCHNGRGEISAMAPVVTEAALMRDGDAVAGTLIGQRTRWQVPGTTAPSLLVNPAAVPESALLARMRSRSPSSQMPPLGTVVRDAAALELLTAWIQAGLHQPAFRQPR